MATPNPPDEGQHSIDLDPRQQQYFVSDGYSPDDLPLSMPDPANLTYTSNVLATSTNAALPPPDVNPDDFYRTYRGVQSGTPHIITHPPLPFGPAAPAPSAPHRNRMTSSTSSQRRPPITRPIANGTTSKPGTQTRVGIRSASAPLDRSGCPRPSSTRTAAANPSTSVRDLKKRFDQHQRTPAAARRKANSRPGSRSSSPSAAGPMWPSSHGPGPTSASYSTLRSGTTREASGRRSPAGQSTQRQKYVPEDQLSNNSQSFASRISKPKVPPSPKSSRPLRMTTGSRLTPEPRGVVSKESSISPRSQRLLFGEVLPGRDPGTQSAGFGIENDRPRRTSESNLFLIPRQHQRSLSDPDVDLEPNSPTDWYRDTSRPSHKQRTSPSMAKNHGRARSDLGGSGPSSLKNNRNLGRQSPSSSRIPLSVRKLTSETRSKSPSSARSPSPSTQKSAHPRHPSSNIPPRIQTPTKTSVGKREGGNPRLTVSISSPPLRTSPQLRSSRPRQPVSSATTVSSRRKLVNKASSKQSSKQNTENNRRRKLSIGPIDFEQRREHIRMAYTKSIRASQVLEAKQVAEEIKRREAEADAKAQAEAATNRISASELLYEDTQHPEAAGSSEYLNVPEMTDMPLRLATSFDNANEPSMPKVSCNNQLQNIMDSPTLGIPGSFPLSSPSKVTDEEPKSAVSDNTIVTEFDNETQTEPARSQTLSMLSAEHTSNIPTISAVEKATYRQPSCFDEDQFPDEATPIATLISHSLGPAESGRTIGHAKENFIPDALRNDPELDSRLTFCRKSLNYEPDTEFEHELDPGNESEPETEIEDRHEQHIENDSENSHGQWYERDTGPAQELGVKEYEPQPFKFESSDYTTTVTIVSRESSVPFSSQANEGETDNLVSTQLFADEGQNEYRIRLDPVDVRTFQHISHSEENTPTEEGIPEPQQELSHPRPLEAESGEKERDEVSDGLDGLEQFYVGPQVRDSGSIRHESTVDSREAESHLRSSVAHTEDSSCTSFESQRGAESTRNLSVPSLMSPANRASQHSAWTDFSVDSADLSAQPLEPMPPLETKSTAGSETHRIRMLREALQPHNPDLSPRDAPVKHHLPELDTGGGFSLPYLSQHDDNLPNRPDHAPLSVLPAAHSTYASSLHSANGQYDSSRPDSLHFIAHDDKSSFTMGPSLSRRESQDFCSSPSPSPQHSIDQGSFESVDGHYTPASGADVSSLDVSRPDDGATLVSDSVAQLAGGEEMAQGNLLTIKERNRLHQRQMVIRELVDTEAVFIRDMNIVEEIYKGTAEACPKLDLKTIKLIFRNTDEIIAFHTAFVAELRDSVSPVYTPKGRRSPLTKEENGDGNNTTPGSTGHSVSSTELDDSKDRQTSLGPAFLRNIEGMKATHEIFLKNSDHAAKRLEAIQQDSTVKVWLNECNEVAKDLTQAWNLDSLLIKPMQRLTKYPNLISQMLQYTPADHPDKESLITARTKLEEAIFEINKTKKNFELVGQIVGRKRKESDVRAGIGRILGKRVDKLQSANRPPEDPEYAKLHERFGDDYLRLQVVLRDVEFYTRQVAAYVHEFLQYLSSMELVMRLQPGPFPELESKWVRFNVSMRDIEKVALENHLNQVRKQVIEPFELVIKSYGNPSLAMKKRAKRRLDYERSVQLKKSGKKMDKQLAELVEQYEALNDTLKKELPKLSSLTEKVGNICLGNFVNIQAKWYSIWQEKVKAMVDEAHVPEIDDIILSFKSNFQFADEQFQGIKTISTGPPSIRTSQSTTEESQVRVRSRPADLSSPRGRGLSVASESVPPSLPTPDFVRRHSGQLTLSPTGSVNPGMPSPGNYYRDYYTALNNGQGKSTMASSISPGDMPPSRVHATHPPAAGRPSTGRSYDSGAASRYYPPDSPVQMNRRDSNSTYNSSQYPQENKRFSGIFHSALPLPDGEDGQMSSRASSRERVPSGGYNILWLAASLFEFNIDTIKTEAGYPYLTYQAGEIFDVIAEKGELWLAKNQDDPREQVGWIWSKHFAKLADS